jgi:metal transporter CNNM
MTPISDVFMLSIDSQLDYALLKKICLTGHSRVPVYEEIDIPASVTRGDENHEGREQRTQKVRKIVGILLVKQCVLLDPKGIYPLIKWYYVVGCLQQLRCYSPSQYPFKQSTICP